MEQRGVIIIGAGVAGSCLAKLLQKQGIDALVIEKSKDVLVKDSGLVSTRLFNFFDGNVARHFIKDEIRRMCFVSPEKNTTTLETDEPFALILKRRQFEESLRKNLDIIYEKPWKIDYFNDHCHVWTDKNDYECKMVVGCDGCHSFVRKQAGLPDLKCVHGVIARTEKSEPTDVTVFLNKNYSQDGFAWHIPQNNEYGLLAENNIDVGLSALKQDMLGDQDVQIQAAPIPIGFAKSFAHRTLLVGDAASQTKPLTGGGIIFSMTCAKHARDAICSFLEKNSLDCLGDYERNWRNDIGTMIKQQLFFRKVYSRMGNKTMEKLFNTFKSDIESFRHVDYDNLLEQRKNLSRTKLVSASLRMPVVIMRAIL
ncbi:MAG: NAD(P)/FAD-dependent oxidoreductase [Candidatus Aenigmatarchaeota archaeon]